MAAAARILVVEDNVANQLLVSAVLERGGFIVEIAESGPAALRSIHDRRPDLILMDVQLGGEDGLSLTRDLKAQDATASIPVVALTAHAMVGHKEEALAAGCTGYITKPINTRTFVDKVRRFLTNQAVDTFQSTAHHFSGGHQQ